LNTNGSTLIPTGFVARDAHVETQTGLPLLIRYSGNPLLTQKSWPYPINSVFNAGVAKLADGDTLLLCRVEDRRGMSHLCAARSANGIDNWRIDAEPTLPAKPREYPEELWGLEDPRITYVPELEQFAVVYTSYAHGGPGVSLAMTKDFRSFERYGVIMQPEDKDSALLPRRFGGLWALIHRPVTTLGAHMWISYSPDLRHWGGHKIIAKGWLTIYHGVRQTASGSIYRLGLALFDLDRPEICLQRGDSWMFGPEASYERSGDVKDVVFPCGQTIGEDGDTIMLYYGAADSSIALATGSVRTLLAWLEANSSSWEGKAERRKQV